MSVQEADEDGESERVLQGLEPKGVMQASTSWYHPGNRESWLRSPLPGGGSP